jgi:hypothetical protein
MLGADHPASSTPEPGSLGKRTSGKPPPPLSGPINPATALAGVSLFAACATTGIQIATPFDNGVWLVAYLILVGFAAQALLARGQIALLGSSARKRAIQAQVVLWNLGVVAVPFGVLADARLSVVLGGISLLAALATYWRTTRPGYGAPGSAPARLRYGYTALLMLMTASVFAGTAMAWDRPWLH